ncbi:MAG: hypothetical protein RLZ98_2577 [Pseudomonadota bacterium]|jgi:uncharacterized MAPEG superfamily protein
MDQFSEYAYAIASMAGFVLLTLAIGPFAAGRKARDGLVSGASPTPDYSDLTYRLWRAHLNASEMMGVFVAATVSAILAGAAPSWVNIIAVLFFLSRIAHAVVHIAGVGAADYGPRTYLFIFGWFMCAFLALMAIFAVFGGAV